ncbi:unnamed protein product, partial [Arabidopsis halleri]
MFATNSRLSDQQGTGVTTKLYKHGLPLKPKEQYS